MNAESIHIHYKFRYGQATTTTADINVPGLGAVEIKNCVSQETIDAIEKEVIIALRQKLGMIIEAASPKEPAPAPAEAPAAEAKGEENGSLPEA